MVRHWLVAAALLAATAGVLAAQQPTPQDTMHMHGDTLGREPVQLRAVTVTAAAPRRDEPEAAVTVSPTVIARTPAINTYELLRQSAGVEVHDQGQGPGFASDASIRGFSSDHSTDMALWVDGVPINEPVNGHAEGYADWNLLMPQAVQAIDVLKGPTDVRFGNFALAGVVNARTLDRMAGTQAWFETGSNAHMDAGALTGWDRSGSGGVFGVRVLGDGGWRPNSDYKLAQGHARFGTRLSDATTLDAGVELYGTDWSSPGFLTDSLFQEGVYDVVSNESDGGFKRRAQERVSLRVLAGPSVLWRSTAYATQSRWQLYLTTPPEGGATEGSGSQTEEEDRRHGFGLTSAITWAATRAEVNAGGELRWDQADYEQYYTSSRTRDSAGTLADARQVSAALFAQLTSDFGHHVRVSAGGRYDALDTRSGPPGGSATSGSYGVFSPKLGALVHLRRLWSVYANVSRGFRQTDGVLADPSLGPITAWSYETGVRIDHQRLSGSVALFRMDVSNEQTFDPITATSSSGGSSLRRGVEVEADARLTPALRARVDWTFLDATYSNLVTEDGDTLSGARVFNTSRYVGAASLELAPPVAHWFARLSTNAVGPYTPFDEPGVELPAYALLHLVGGLDLDRLRLQIGMRNILDRAYPELRAGGFVVPGQPRTVFISAVVRTGAD